MYIDNIEYADPLLLRVQSVHASPTVREGEGVIAIIVPVCIKGCVVDLLDRTG